MWTHYTNLQSLHHRMRLVGQNPGACNMTCPNMNISNRTWAVSARMHPTNILVLVLGWVTIIFLKSSRATGIKILQKWPYNGKVTVTMVRYHIKFTRLDYMM